MLNHLKELNEIRQAETEQFICDLELARAVREAAREHSKPRRKGAAWLRKLFRSKKNSPTSACGHPECPLRSPAAASRP